MPPKVIANKTPIVKSVVANKPIRIQNTSPVAGIVPIAKANTIAEINITDENVSDELNKLEEEILTGLKATKDQAKLQNYKKLLDTLSELEDLSLEFAKNQKNIIRQATYIKQTLFSLK